MAPVLLGASPYLAQKPVSQRENLLNPYFE
jgi:hypothetical protein